MHAARKLEPAPISETMRRKDLELAGDLDAGDDPVLAAFLHAPLDDEPLTGEERAELFRAVSDIQQGREAGVPGEVVHAEVMRAVRALEGRGPEWDAVTLGEVLRWLDTGEASPKIAALLAG